MEPKPFPRFVTNEYSLKAGDHVPLSCFSLNAATSWVPNEPVVSARVFVFSALAAGPPIPPMAVIPISPPEALFCVWAPIGDKSVTF